MQNQIQMDIGPTSRANRDREDDLLPTILCLMVLVLGVVALCVWARWMTTAVAAVKVPVFRQYANLLRHKQYLLSRIDNDDEIDAVDCQLDALEKDMTAEDWYALDHVRGELWKDSYTELD